MNKFFNMLFILFLPLSTANALELGQIKLESYLNEPLNASFTLAHIETDHIGDIFISLADQESYKSFGLTKPYVLNKVKFEISADTKDRYLVNISTQQRIKDPILDLLVKVSEKQGSVTRLFTLILDPRDDFISKQAATSQITTNHINPASITDVLPSEAEQDVNQRQTDKSSPKRIKVVNDSISMLAQNSELHDKYSVYQIMRAYYLLNKEAFRHGNINHLKAGVTLITPDEELVSEVSRQKSIDFVYSASSNDPFNKTVTTQLKVAVPDSDKTTSSVQASKFSGKELTDAEQQNALTTEQSTILQKSMPNEIEHPQQPAQEDSSLPVLATDNQTLLNTNNNELNTRQQEIIIQQQADIDELKLSLTSKLDEIEGINRRLNVLELQNNNSPIVETITNAEVPPPPVIKVEPLKVGIQQESYSDAITWAVAFIVLLFLLNREIIWRRRLKELDIYIMESKKETVNDDMLNESTYEEINYDSKDDNALNETPLEVGQNQAEIDSSYNKTIVEEIHYEPVARDIPDKATIDDEPVIDNSSSEFELDFNLEFSDDELNIAENTVELDAEDLEDFNQQLADEKYQSAVSAAKNYKNEDSDNLQSKVDEEKEDQLLLYSEIDVLIAYELYEEAFELIDKSRENFVNNKGDLDIRELEILAYLKNEELFFPMFEQLKESLSKNYPVEWKKIIELSEQMSRSGPKLTAVI